MLLVFPAYLEARLLLAPYIPTRECFFEILVEASEFVFKAVLSFIDIRHLSPGQHPGRYGNTVKARVKILKGRSQDEA